MALSTQPYKGARDFYPEDLRLEKYIFSVWRDVCERFGYEEYDAPILEPTELYLSKGNEEIIKEQTYSFEDRGGRKVTVRTEMTPTVSRMVAGRRQELAYPLRWYSIPNCWRYERPQRGRGREFYQLNADLFGIGSIAADEENIQLADAIMVSFGASRDMYSIALNSRTLTDYILCDYLGLDSEQAHAMSVLIDRMHKMEQTKFIAAADAICTPVQRSAAVVEKLLRVLDSAAITDLPTEIKNQPAVTELTQLVARLKVLGITNASFDATLMRGFDYYTGIVFEVNDVDPENNRSMFGGGRYEGLVAMFGVEPVSSVGFGMGDITIANFLKSHHLMPDIATETDIYVVLVGDVHDESANLVAELRGGGLKVAVDLSERKLGDQIKTASKKGIPYILVIGEEELKSKTLSLKNLQTGNDEQLRIPQIITKLKGTPK